MSSTEYKIERWDVVYDEKQNIKRPLLYILPDESLIEFSKSNKNPNKFKYTYTKRRTGEVEEMEFTIDEFNTYNNFMKEYVRIQDIAEKFQTIE